MAAGAEVLDKLAGGDASIEGACVLQFLIPRLVDGSTEELLHASVGSEEGGSVGELGVPSAGLGVALGGWHRCGDEGIEGGNLPLRNEGGAIELEA